MTFAFGPGNDTHNLSVNKLNTPKYTCIQHVTLHSNVVLFYFYDGKVMFYFIFMTGRRRWTLDVCLTGFQVVVFCFSEVFPFLWPFVSTGRYRISVITSLGSEVTGHSARAPCSLTRRTCSFIFMTERRLWTLDMCLTGFQVVVF